MAEAGKQTKGKKLTFLAMHQVNFHFIPFKKWEHLWNGCA